MKNRLRLIMIGIMILVCGVLLYFTVPDVAELVSLVYRYDASAAERNDYTKITTPLPQDVTDDICTKFKLDPIDERCLPESVVYGPDFFEDIKEYFRKLPDQEATLQTAEDRLGTYLVACENPNDEGHYRCQYDLRGDGLYPISIYFTKEGYIYRVMANIGGS
jgi:hypothetical protein